MATGLKTETLIVLGVGLGVLVLAKIAADKAGQAALDLWDYSVDKAKYLNPVDENNLANQAANGIWKWVTGSDQTIGADAYDYVHKAEPAPGGTGLTNYTKEQQDRDYEAMKRLERGYHGM